MKTRRSDAPVLLTRLSKIRNIVVLALFAATALIAASATSRYTTLIDFNGANGLWPEGSLVQGFDGNYYGTTAAGGANGGGTVFKITPSGTFTTLYSGLGSPHAGLVLAKDGNFYGTTYAGGAYGFGTVFKITSTGKLTVLYNFCAQASCLDGEYPLAGLVQASDGNFYGTTAYGGANTEFCDNSGCGTVFKITPTGKLTTLYSFCAQANCVDGGIPWGLVQASNGDFYGTTQGGGPNVGYCVGFLNGCGTVFEITPAGKLTTLYGFCAQANCSDGALPSGALVQASNGNLYGATQNGGNAPPDSAGTVFEITPDGVLTTLHSFDVADAWAPNGSLIQATDGYLYGTTSGGDGTIFKMTPSGTLTTVHNFDFDGQEGTPQGGLVQGTNGEFYGTTFGSVDLPFFGSVFSFSMGLRSFVETLPASGKVGTAVMILGNNLNGATNVTFNGTPATFKVVGSSAIETIVPAGATSGRVDVTTPTEKLESNVSFVVK